VLRVIAFLALEHAQVHEHGIEIFRQLMPEIVGTELQPVCRLALRNLAHRASQAEDRTGKAMADLYRVHDEHREQEQHHEQERSLVPPQVLQVIAERSKRVRQYLQHERGQAGHGEERDPMQDDSPCKRALNAGIDKHFATLWTGHASSLIYGPRG